MAFAFPVDQTVKIKDEKIKKYQDLTRELKKRETWKWRRYQLEFEH